MTKRKRERLPLISRRPYTGILAAATEVTGMRGPEGQLTMTDEGRQLVDTVKKKKLKAVFEMFGISENDPLKWQLLAEALFENCVPGAQVVLVEPRKMRGRRRKYDGNYSLEQFALQVDAEVKKGFPRNEALTKVGSDFGSDAKLRGLRNMYSEGKIRWAMLIGSISSSENDEYLADLLKL